MKWYIDQLYDELKELYFKNFQYLNVEKQVLEKKFDETLFKCDPEYVLKINDYNGLIQDDNYKCNSKFMKVYQNLLDETSQKIQKALSNSSSQTKEVINILKSSDKNVYLVGGACRSACCDKSPKDFDFVSNIEYSVLEKMFKDNGYSIKEVGKKTLILIITKNNETFEIAVFRKEGTYEDGRRPTLVTIGTLLDDSKRRDFTCNSIYYNLKTGDVLDTSGTGILDCKSRILRTVGSSDDRLSEDLLRVLRAYRFMVVDDFKPTDALLKACRRNFRNMARTIAPERFRLEIEKMAGV